MAAGGDDDVLAAVVAQAVGHRRRMAGRGEPALPELAAALAVEGSREKSVVAPMKTRPLAVTSGPPRLGVPVVELRVLRCNGGVEVTST